VSSRRTPNTTEITPSIVLRWQHELEGNLSHSG
jgi:hypothetical protein